jgi:uncharacterized protein (TIGR02996 family)
MTEAMLHPELLQAILDDPADDTVRLIAADWLEEHGEEQRAEFLYCNDTCIVLQQDA